VGIAANLTDLLTVFLESFVDTEGVRDKIDLEGGQDEDIGGKLKSLSRWVRWRR
jgi:hypothetical protein